MNGLEFEKFYKKYNLEIDVFDSNSCYVNLLYKSVPVCKYYKNPMTGERYISFPGKVWAIENFNKACAWFDTNCIVKTKEIDILHKLKEMNKDFE